jgi:hypothetical protein
MTLLESKPDTAKCKTRFVKDDLYYCVTRDGYKCRYSIRLGNEFFCDHHERHAFEVKDFSRGIHNDITF